jgi:DNA-binding HxlR family transcriptional regulator
MRSYNQLCGLAKALDVIGDRWSLLIVRELLLRDDGARYTDLREGLPGIATNLLSERLRALEEAGIVEKRDVPPPVATTLFHLTDRGRELREPIHALGRWGSPLLAESSGDETFLSHWLGLPLEIYGSDHRPSERPATIEVRAGGEPLLVEVGGGDVRARPGADEHADMELSGPPKVIVGLFAGRLTLAEARNHGLEAVGDPAVLARVQPAAFGDGRKRRRPAKA